MRRDRAAKKSDCLCICNSNFSSQNNETQNTICWQPVKFNFGDQYFCNRNYYDLSRSKEACIICQPGVYKVNMSFKVLYPTQYYPLTSYSSFKQDEGINYDSVSDVIEPVKQNTPQYFNGSGRYFPFLYGAAYLDDNLEAVSGSVVNLFFETSPLGQYSKNEFVFATNDCEPTKLVFKFTASLPNISISNAFVLIRKIC